MNNTNIIGVIGGMGPQASAEFYRILIHKARHEFGAHANDAYPEIVMDSVPVPDFLSSLDDMERAARMLEDRVERLTAFGATHITMACNTACILADRLQKKTHVPFLSVVDEVVGRVVRGSQPHFAKAPRGKGKVLVLASPTSLRMGLYQLALARYGVETIVPEEKDFAELEYIIRSVIDGEDRTPLMKKLVKLAERYLDPASDSGQARMTQGRGVKSATTENTIDGIVLGCTELPLVFPVSHRLPVYSSLDILAEAVLKRYYYKKESI